MTGRTQELKLDKTTIGRAEDNTVQIAEEIGRASCRERV